MTLSREAARTTLEGILREVFDDESLTAVDSTLREEVKSWDSLGHIRLVSAIEESFGINLTIEEIESMTSVGRILDVVSAQGQRG